MQHLAVFKNRSTRVPFAVILFFSLTVAAAGCRETNESKPVEPQASISGIVTNDGKNVTPDSSVVFFCKEKDATASGQVDSMGKYILRPTVGSIGIPAGRYQVAVRSPVPPTPVIGSKEYEDQMAGKAKKPEPAKDIPPQFEAFDTSGISVEVKVGENRFDFDLAKLAK